MKRTSVAHLKSLAATVAAGAAHSSTLRQTALAPRDESTVQQALRMSIPAVEGFLLATEQAATHRGIAGKEKILDWVKEARENIHTDDWMKSKGEVALAASRGDREAVDLHAAAVMVTTNNFVSATSNWLPFFEMRSLAPAEYPGYVPERKGQGVTIDAIGQDGGNITRQSATTDPNPIFVPINLRSTPWIEYPLQDLYTGSVKEMALAQFDVARDRAIREDSLLASYLIVGGTNSRLTDTFTTTGDEADRDYVVEPNVNAANLPVGNLITLTGNSTTSLFRKEVFDEILKYCGQWGSNLQDGGSLMPVEITIASAHMYDFLRQVSMTSQPNQLVDQVFNGGFVMSYGGRTWVVTGANTLDPNLGVAYVRTNLPIGLYYDKPNMADVLLDESPELRRQNKGRTCEVWAEAFLMPKHWRKRTLGIRYKTPV